MSEHVETRKILWNQGEAFACRAQELDREAEDLQHRLNVAKANAVELRRCAKGFREAAAILGEMDEPPKS